VIFDFSLATGFTTRSRTLVGTFPNKLASGDMDNDNLQDLVVLTRDAADVRVGYGDGDGAIAEVVAFAFDFPAGRIQPLDLNDDGLLDVVASDGLSRVWYKLNQGDRQFAAQSFVNAGSGALDLASEDLDGDGDGDLVVANRTEHTLSFFENTGTGGLVRRVGGHALPGAPVGLVVADFNDDGRQDVLVNLQGNGTLGLVNGVQDWVYTLPGEYVSGPVVSGMYAGDFNLDSVPDIMVLDSSLLLGLMLLNVEPGQVAVAPTAVTASCDGDALQLRIRPDRPGPWTLELGRSGLWRLAASGGRAFVGEWDFDAGTWLLNLGVEVGDNWLPGSGDQWQARLTVGVGADSESEVWSLDSTCLPSAGGAPPRLAWRTAPWPNPFNPRVQARFSLGEAGWVTVAIYDLAGRLLATLAEDEFSAGDHLVRWDGVGPDGPAAAGAYLMRIESEAGVLSRKLMLIK